MLTVAFTFPGGYIHSTPWGRHVNEGEVEWPPSPWRIARALLATGLSRCGWSEIPDDARDLIQALGQMPASWSLPRGGLGHTRHYMPSFKSGQTDKVIDAFVYIGREGTAYAQWELDLPPRQLELLDALLFSLGYLGRAESWVEARRVSSVPVTDELFECLLSDGLPSEGRYEPIEGLALMPRDTYAAWRQRALAAQSARRLAELRNADRSKGKAPRAKLTTKESKKIEAGYPVDPVDTLLSRTSELRKAGWSQPPGTWRSVVWRRREVLEPDRTPVPTVHFASSPTFALFRITPDTVASPTLAPMRDALRRAEGIHTKLVKITDGKPVFTASGVSGHQDAHILPLSLDQALPRERLPYARFDHLLLWAPMGFDGTTQAILMGGFSFYWKNLPKQRATLIGLTDRAERFNGRVPVARTARRWVTETPWIAPRYLKKRGKNGAEGQIRALLESRGFPPPKQIEIEDAEGRWIDASEWRGPNQGIRLAPWWRLFRIAREGEGAPQPPQRLAFGIRLTFSEEVSGPICLGYGAHLGLGRFAPDR